MRKFFSITLVCIFILSLLTGCGREGSVSPDPSSEIGPVSEEALINKETSQQYEMLDERGKTIYARLLYASQSRDTRLVLMPKGSVFEDIDLAFNAMIDDTPSLFWLAKTCTIIPDGEDVLVRLKYLVEDEAALAVMQAKLDIAVDEAFAAVPEGASDFERERAIHDWLIERVSYNDNAADDTTGRYAAAYTIYGALVDGSAVCEGYSRAMQFLLAKAGIPCTLITGKSRGAAHMWNVVTIGGKRYHLDATWNDVIPPAGISYTSYLYFNVTDEQISADHSYFEPAGCTSIDENYAVKTGTYYTEYNQNIQNAITSVLAQGAQAGNTSYEFRFASTESYEAAYAALVTNQGIFSLLQMANESLPEPLIQDRTVSFGSGGDSNCTIVVLITLL